jgi:hypothetical protein
MQASFVVSLLAGGFAPSHLGGLSNVLQVFQGDGRPCGRVLHDAFTQDVIVIFASPKLFPAHRLQMSPGGAGAFGLQLSFHSEGPPLLFFPSPLSQEVTIGGDGGTVQSQVYSYDLWRCEGGGCRDGDDDMQGIAPVAGAQIGATGLVADILREVSGDVERRSRVESHSWCGILRGC